MKKPSPYKQVRHPYTGISSRCLAYTSGSALHCAMQQWANSKRRFTVTCAAEYDDGSLDLDVHTFERIQKEVSYYCPFSEENYEVYVDTGRFDAGIYSEFIPDYDTEKGASMWEAIAALRAWLDSKADVLGATTLTWHKEYP